MASDFIRINIVFIPPADIVESAMKLSEEISKQEDAYFFLDNQNFYPHITIYSPEYPAHNLEKILVAVKDLSKNLLSVKLIFKKIMTTQGYIGVEFEYTEEIRTIHEAIIEKLNSLREGYTREKYIDFRNIKFSDQQKKNIKKYGYLGLMNLYEPHLTITRLKDEKIAERVAGEIQWPIKEFRVDKIGAYKMGENGTCIELIKEFNLGKIL